MHSVGGFTNTINIANTLKIKQNKIKADFLVLDNVTGTFNLILESVLILLL